MSKKEKITTCCICHKQFELNWDETGQCDWELCGGQICSIECAKTKGVWRLNKYDGEDEEWFCSKTCADKDESYDDNTVKSGGTLWGQKYELKKKT